MGKVNMLGAAITAATRSLEAYYEFSRGIGHSVEKGGFREFFLAQLIRPFIPPLFGVGSGVVVDAKGNESSQADVIIYDSRLLPPVFLAGGRGVYPIDSVLAVVEVKTKLRKAHYKQLLKAARCFSPRCESNPTGLFIATKGRDPQTGERVAKTTWPLYAVFAYEASAKHQDEQQPFEGLTPDGPRYIKLICVLNRGVWTSKNGKYNCHISSDARLVAENFLIMLLNKLVDTANSRGEYRLEPWLPDTLGQ